MSVQKRRCTVVVWYSTSAPFKIVKNKIGKQPFTIFPYLCREPIHYFWEKTPPINGILTVYRPSCETSFSELRLRRAGGVIIHYFKQIVFGDSLFSIHYFNWCTCRNVYKVTAVSLRVSNTEPPRARAPRTSVFQRFLLSSFFSQTISLVIRDFPPITRRTPRGAPRQARRVQ